MRPRPMTQRIRAGCSDSTDEECITHDGRSALNRLPADRGAGHMEGAELRNAAERQLWDAFPFGKEVDLGDGEPAVDGFDPDNWGSDRHMRGEVLVRLLLG